MNATEAYKVYLLRKGSPLLCDYWTGFKWECCSPYQSKCYRTKKEAQQYINKKSPEWRIGVNILECTLIIPMK